MLFPILVGESTTGDVGTCEDFVDGQLTSVAVDETKTKQETNNNNSSQWGFNEYL